MSNLYGQLLWLEKEGLHGEALSHDQGSNKGE